MIVTGRWVVLPSARVVPWSYTRFVKENSMNSQFTDARAELAHIIADLHYPQTATEIREVVATAGSGDGVVSLVATLPDTTFTSAQEVLAAID